MDHRPSTCRFRLRDEQKNFPNHYCPACGWVKGEPCPHDTPPDELGEVLAENMTLRDWFAGQALVAMYNSGVRGFSIADMAMGAYQHADAMMAERGARKKST